MSIQKQPPAESGRSSFAEGILDDQGPPVIVPPPRIEAPPVEPIAAPEELPVIDDVPRPVVGRTGPSDRSSDDDAGEGKERRRTRRGRRGGRKHRRKSEGEQADRAAVPAVANDSMRRPEWDAVESGEERAELQDGTEALATPVAPLAMAAPIALPRPDRVTPTEVEGEEAGEGEARTGRRRRRRGGRGRGRRGRRSDGVADDASAEAPEEITSVEPDEEAMAGDDELPIEEESSGPAAPVRVVEDLPATMVRTGLEMLINMADGDECRIAMLNNGRLDELYMERVSAASHVGNIYKGRVTNVEPSIQAAFVDFGLPTQGFLHISDLHPLYFPDGKSDSEQVGRKTPRRDRPPIQRCLRRGQEVIVQITKEGIGTKGPTLTTYISVPGRFLVMMPGMEQHGVSRKIEDDETRRKLRDMLAQLPLPSDMGFIMRTAAIDRPKRDLQRDLAYLMRLWRSVDERTRTERAPCVLYQESDLVIRTIRDVFDSDVKRIVCDDHATARRISEFLAIASPRSQDVVYHYAGREPMFHVTNIEAEIDKLHSNHVPLPCGGSLVIESTEALVAIDVNSGRFRVPDDPEETAYRVNLEAADEIARQLRLRDLGGLIICDFIDMRMEKHKRAIERRLRDALKRHKERAKCLRISPFGIIEMTRQRQRPSFSGSLYQDCPRCRGTGLVKTPESVALDVMRAIGLAAHRDGIAIIDVQVSTTVANHLLNRKRRRLADIEAETGRTIVVRVGPDFAVDEVRISCTDRRGREIPFTELYSIGPTVAPRPGPERLVQIPVATPSGGPSASRGAAPAARSGDRRRRGRRRRSRED